MRPLPPTTDDGFAAVAFHALPLACLGVPAAVAAVTGPEWTGVAAPFPWLVSLVFVGLPHGAADLAVSRRAWRGWPLAGLWAAYAVIMAIVATGFVVAPAFALAMFTALSCWHFGLADADLRLRPRCGWGSRGLAAAARGCVVLAVPLLAWTDATAEAATELVSLATPAAAEVGPASVRRMGVALAAVGIVAIGLEGMASAGVRGCLAAWARGLLDLVVIGACGWFTDPLFSVGTYFLFWHGWRQMQPLTTIVDGRTPRSWTQLAAALRTIHAAALPLLLPTWLALAFAWWAWSPGRSPRDLAILSIGVYLVVTPAHELLGDLLPEAIAVGRRSHRGQSSRPAMQPSAAGQPRASVTTAWRR
jgi:Brp/Blh family beta-carotene 15,15'-monooxygenase